MALQHFQLSFRAAPRAVCSVHVGAGALSSLVEDLVQGLALRRLVLISDSNVALLHGRPLLQRLRDRGLSADMLVFPAGEASKTRETKSGLEDGLLALGIGRDSAVIALGGGVSGDLGGFVAATWQRGVPVVQVPTSLLAMVDACLGGKTAVDLPGAKNMVGSFHQPWGVYADIDLLATLPEAEYVQGFAEVVKSAAIADVKLFRWLEDAASLLVQRDVAALEHAVRCCLAIKARVVARDERDSGPRAMLNFGHTVAHALETLSGYRIGHGFAVGHGLRAEARMAIESTGFPPRHLVRLERLLDRLGLPAAGDPPGSEDALLAALRRDKKTRGGQVHCALPERLGRMPVGRILVPVDELRLVHAVFAAVPAPRG